MRFPILGRLATVAGVAVVLLIPLSMIRDKVAERRDRAAAVQKSFAEQTTGEQVLAGPFLALTCEETYADGREKKQRPCSTGLFVPADLKVQATAHVDQRYRGIYPIHLYRAKVELSGAFALPPQPAPGAESARAWKDAFLVLAISDVRGIKDAAGARFGDGNYEFAPGTPYTHLRSGLHADLGAYANLVLESDLAFHIPLELVGTSRLAVAPVGNQTQVQLDSGWPHPSFVGAYAPDRREVGASGFSALWQVNHFATGGNAFWLEAAASDKLFSSPRLLGVAFVDPVNPYSMSYRATQYGFLFVLLTFAAFSLVELVWGVKLHAVQYALAGSALAVFFLLLIALSEHIGFGWAYCAAAASCIALLAFYLSHPLGSLARTALFGALFAALYGALYVLLQSEDHSLLLGSLLVFGLLAAVMALTRKLDWVELSGRLRQPLADAP